VAEVLSFRRATTGSDEEAELAESDNGGLTAGEYLTARLVELIPEKKLRQHRVAPGVTRSEGYDRLDNEILAGRRLHSVAGGRYPPQLACLYGDQATSADPCTLFEPYQGEPLHEVVGRLLPEAQEEVIVDLLTGLCWLASASIAHRAISPETVLWNGEQAQLTDFSKCTVFGVPRTPVSGTQDWVAREQRQDETYGSVGASDDVWAAGRLIFYVRNQGENLTSRAQLARDGLGAMLDGVFDAPEHRPTAGDLLRRMGRSAAVPLVPRGTRLLEGERRFWAARRQKHPDAAVPADCAWLLDGRPDGAPPDGGPPPVGGSVGFSTEPVRSPGATTPNGSAPRPEAPDGVKPKQGRHTGLFRRGGE
jgi:hypothetical protein